MNTLATLIGKCVVILVWMIIAAVLAVFAVPFSKDVKLPKGDDEELFL